MLSMASCGLGASDVKLVSLKFDRAVKISELSICKSRSCFVQKVHNYAGLRIVPRLDRGLSLCCSPSTGTEVVVAENAPEEFQFSGPPSDLIPTASELESLLTVLCETTSIAEFEVKLNGFRLYIKRDIAEQHTRPPPSPLPSPVYAATSPETPETDGSISKSSVALTKSFSNGTTSLLDKAADEGLAILQSPRVGFFRRSRTIKGKRAPPACKEKQIVKEGQVLCYIDQLGGEIPVESDVSGEVVKILREDGEPVGYADALISILPSFPGIKKLH